MVELQILSYVLQTKDVGIIENNELTVDYFPGYKEEYEFIMEHYKDYGNVPDKLTFLSQFQKFEIVEVSESEEYLVYTIREENLYANLIPFVQNIADRMKTNSNEAAEYARAHLNDFQPNYKLGGVDIIQKAIDRFDAFVDRRDNQENWYFTTGFPELDDIIHGISRTEELFVIYARTNEGKSWVAEKICTHVWEIGFNVGFISPEMGELSVGYRFDTLHGNFSNQGMSWGKKDFNEAEYKEYINKLKERKNKFIVATPSDFNNHITVTKLRQFISKYKLDLVCVDGITYMSDERGKKNDNKTTSLTNIAEDLKTLGMELKVPILTVVQANRNGAVSKDSDELPELESIRDSDGIAHNATIVLAVKHSKDGVMTMQIKKGRGNRVGDKINYQWNPDIGEFISENGTITTDRHKKKKVIEKEDVF